VNATVVRCERSDNADVVAKISQTPGVYLRHDPNGWAHLKATGYVPCTTPDGAPVSLCNYR
jgi:hypothetical protein